jgi:uncharacterized iron-regulated membrane protein
MRDASKLLFAAGLICGVLGVAWHVGLLAVTGVVLLIAGLLVRSLAPRPVEPPSDVERPRFGPTSVASTVPGGGARSFDPPRD